MWYCSTGFSMVNLFVRFFIIKWGKRYILILKDNELKCYKNKILNWLNELVDQSAMSQLINTCNESLPGLGGMKTADGCVTWMAGCYLKLYFYL